MQIAFESMLMPVVGIFQRAYESGEFNSKDSILLSGTFISVMSSIRDLPERFTRRPKMEMAEAMIDVFLNGLRPR